MPAMVRLGIAVAGVPSPIAGSPFVLAPPRYPKFTWKLNMLAVKLIKVTLTVWGCA